jgi:hypothetical protein
MNRVVLALGTGLIGATLMLLSDQPLDAAHGGGLDRYGCHNDRKAGGYHCHRGPCAGKAFTSQVEMLRDSCSR